MLGAVGNFFRPKGAAVFWIGLLVAGWLFVACAMGSQRYGRDRLREEGTVNQQCAGRRVEILKTSGERVAAYFIRVRGDSLVIAPGKGDPVRMKIARDDIDAVVLVQKTHPEVLLLLGALSVVGMLLAMGWADALSSAGH